MAGSEYMVLLRVMNHDIDFPVGTSQESIDLIQRCVAPEASKRLTLREIRNHAFFHGMEKYFLEETVPNTDKDCLEYLEKKKKGFPSAGKEELGVIKEEEEEDKATKEEWKEKNAEPKENSSPTDEVAQKKEAILPGEEAVSSSASSVGEPHQTFRYFQRNPAIQRPILPLTWHCLKHLRDDEKLIYAFKNRKFHPDDTVTRTLQERFLTLDQWEREARPGQGVSKKMQRFLDEDAKKLSQDEEKEESSDEIDEIPEATERREIAEKNLEATSGKNIAKELVVKGRVKEGWKENQDKDGAASVEDKDGTSVEAPASVEASEEDEPVVEVLS